MTVGIAPALGNSILNHFTARVAWTSPAGLFVKLHLGDPGVAGASNPAVETTRKQMTFGTNASGVSISNTAQVQWTTYPAAETVTHFSVWDAVTAGNFQWSGVIVAPGTSTPAPKTMAIGETLTALVGSLIFNLTPVAA